MMAYGAYYTASGTLTRPGRCQGLGCFASRNLIAGRLSPNGLAVYTASETLARPGRCQGLGLFASRGLFAGGMAFGAFYTATETVARPGNRARFLYGEWDGVGRDVLPGAGLLS